jgi:hypothetical protein
LALLVDISKAERWVFLLITQLPMAPLYLLVVPTVALGHLGVH